MNSLEELILEHKESQEEINKLKNYISTNLLLISTIFWLILILIYCIISYI